MNDRVNPLYTDTPFAFHANSEILAGYVDSLRDTTFQALEEEAILVVVYPVFHSE